MYVCMYTYLYRCMNNKCNIHNNPIYVLHMLSLPTAMYKQVSLSICSKHVPLHTAVDDCHSSCMSLYPSHLSNISMFHQRRYAYDCPLSCIEVKQPESGDLYDVITQC